MRKLNKISAGRIVAGVIGLTMLTSAMLCGGCAAENEQLLGSPSSLMPDVPLPSKFTLVKDNSRMWTDGTLRYADMVYKGNADMTAVQKFYNQQMPISHWVAQSEQYSQGRATLDYIKDTEKCRIAIYNEGLFDKTYVHVVIWPHRPNAKMKPKK